MKRLFLVLLSVASCAAGGNAEAFPNSPAVPSPDGPDSPYAPKALQDDTRAAVLSRSSGVTPLASRIQPDLGGLLASAGLCSRAALAVEKQYRIPDQFLVAMGRVESGRRIASGSVVAWPWTVNAQGRGYVYESKQEAINAVHAFQEQGITSIDVGCLQVNLQQHADAFPSLEAAFDPTTNSNYAARFLVDLFARTGSWPHAAAAYHSFTPDIGSAYQWKVLESWAMPSGGPGAAPPPSASRQPAQAALPRPAISLASNAVRPEGTTRPAAAFNPGIHGYSPPAPRPTFAPGKGRDLAFYRANTIHAVKSAMFNAAPF